MAILTVEDIWMPDKKKEALATYNADDPETHPGVKQLYENTGTWYVGGSLEGITLPIHYDFPHLRLSPSETVRAFTMNGCRRVLGFHTDEYLHCVLIENWSSPLREKPVPPFFYTLLQISVIQAILITILRYAVINPSPKSFLRI